MSKVLVNSLNIRADPSVNSNALDKYNTGDIIKSGDLIIINEGKHWLRYTGGSGNKRYVCAKDSNGSIFVEINKNLPVENRDNGGQSNPILMFMPEEKQVFKDFQNKVVFQTKTSENGVVVFWVLV